MDLLLKVHCSTVSQSGHPYRVERLLNISQLEDIGVLHFGHFGTIVYPFPVIRGVGVIRD
jgi:hypothetical protein